MFDESSRRLLRSAPDLPGLNAETLDELLTEAHIELATIRSSPSDQDAERSSELLGRVRRLASTFEAYVALDLRPDQTRAAAFVAASAHQILARFFNRQADRPTLLSSDAVGATLTSTLLFLIADRAADAAEAAVQLRARGEPRALRRSLILSIREFARGDLAAIVARDLEGDFVPEDDSREYATDLLFRECAYFVQGLAREALGGGPSDDEIARRLLHVISLTKSIGTALSGDLIGLVHNQFAGPHHLATLLLRLLPGVRAAMLVHVPAPYGANNDAWQDWALSQVKSRPFLWINHLNAVATGYLNRGNSMVMTTPTGSGKTTLSVLKIAATLCAGESVVYLAPTHALVDQVESDLSGEVGEIEPVSVEDTALDELGERLPPLSVMTPERCLALLGSAPELFDKVGLLVFDEFHLIGADDPVRSPRISSRAIDSMLALLTFISRRKEADLLLLSAMVANGDEISKWLRSIRGREVFAFDDPWKPTRQLRSCVIYDNEKVIEAAAAANLLPTAVARDAIPAQPLGLFSLISGWHPKMPEKLLIRPLTERTPPLTRKPNGKHTSNRNTVAAQIAADYAALGKRVVIFCADAKSCTSVADSIDEVLEPADIPLDENQEVMRGSILKDVGSAVAAFDPTGRRATVHHGDLLPLERRLAESVFRARRNPEGPTRGLEVIAATSTIAQGLNLPCDVVILAGTDRSAKDDPGGNPRTDLLPHEILNAMGRAGRAAYSATGLAIVIPANPIRIDPIQLKLGQNHEPLKTVFSDQDACENIRDPIALLLDQVEASADADPKVQAMIRRLSSVEGGGETGFDNIAKRSFGYFVRMGRDAGSADAWLESRRMALVAAAAALKDPPVLEWQRELAVRNGVPPEVIERLANQFHGAPTDKAATADWVCWLLDVSIRTPSDLTLFVREASMETVFGRAYKNQAERDELTKLLVEALKTLIEKWCSGRPLVDIESWLLVFIRQNEGPVRKKASNSTSASRARRFAIRILPDIGFLCGLLAQVSRCLEAETGKSPPPIIELLQSMIKAGDFDRHHYILRQETSSGTRVGSFEDYLSMKDGFAANALADIDMVRHEVTSALAIRMFDDLLDE
ncbi:DEXHc_Ski2 domain containing protein [Paracoccaceae bacterium]